MTELSLSFSGVPKQVEGGDPPGATFKSNFSQRFVQFNFQSRV